MQASGREIHQWSHPVQDSVCCNNDFQAGCAHRCNSGSIAMEVTKDCLIKFGARSTGGNFMLGTITLI